MIRLLGILYKGNIEISKNYEEIKEILRKAIQKSFNKNEFEKTFSVNYLVKVMQDKGYKDCNQITIFKAFEEITKEYEDKNENFNIYTNDIIINIDQLPF